jgi:hypothetical protein
MSDSMARDLLAWEERRAQLYAPPEPADPWGDTPDNDEGGDDE